MAAKIPEIPFSYGDILSVTAGHAGEYTFWFKDHSGVIRGVLVEGSSPETLRINSKKEIVIRRATEGQTRRRRSTLPPGTGESNPLQK